MFTLIENAVVYAPQSLGRQSILLANDRIVALGAVDRQAILATGLDCEVIDGSGCVITPGLIDPHEHLIGAGGEEGFSSREPEVLLQELVEAGITTVVGLLATDTTTRTLAALVGKVRELTAHGVTAYMYTGGFQVPSPSLTSSIKDDLILIPEVIGVGEIAIADTRSLEPTIDQLATLIANALIGGMVGGKVGITHFHVGPGKSRLRLLHRLLDEYEIAAESIYPTHISRSQELFDDGIKLAKRGSYVDMDAVDENVGQWMTYYRDHDGPLDRLTISSDAHTTDGRPAKLYSQFVSCVQEYGLSIEDVLPHFTRNTAQALKLTTKGELKVGADADLLLLDRQTLAIRKVFARGQELSGKYRSSEIKPINMEAAL